MAGFFIVLYVLIPIGYWTNSYEAKRFAIYSSSVFNADGGKYNVSEVLNDTTFQFDQHGYDGYSKIHLSIFFVYTYGLTFAILATTISHAALFHGRLWRTIATPFLGSPASNRHGSTLHSPNWCNYCYHKPGLNVIAELVIGYMYPGKPHANMAFKTYGYVSVTQAIMFLSDFKQGHYMKIPPKSMFNVQLVGTLIASSLYFGTSWWLLTSVEHICEPSKLPEGSPWTCPGFDVFYSASIISGVVSPIRMFGCHGRYSKMNYFFLSGFLAPLPVWVLSHLFPEQKWISLINRPIFIGGSEGMPPARAVNYLCWCAVGIFFNFYVYRRYKGWWTRHNYILSAGLDPGVAFMAMLCFFTLRIRHINGMRSWGLELDDHCPLASCPTAPAPWSRG
nr:oligopeptide transporter 5 [Quercus suber]